jgi:nucleotidyltransferase/DNA polymerase involved in DNA repair
VQAFLNPLSVRDLPGVGECTAKKLDAQGVNTIEQLFHMSIAKLKSIFGNKLGAALYEHARGIDSGSLSLEHVWLW